jgi:uncharacterized protein
VLALEDPSLLYTQTARQPAEQAATMQYLTVTIPEKAVTIGSQIGLADTFISRLFGLLGKSSLEDGAGLLIRPSSGVHTMWMRFAIDVIALDKNLRVLRTWQRLRPWRLTPVSFKIHSVLELAPGQVQRFNIEPGDQLVLSS